MGTDSDDWVEILICDDAYVVVVITWLLRAIQM